MTIQLERLEWAARLVGVRFPDADEDGLRRCAQAWHSAAEQLRLVPPEAARIGAQVAEAVAGETAARFEGSWTPAPSVAGLLASLEFAAAAGEERFAHAREAAARCRELLLEAGHEVVTEPGQGTLVTWRGGRST